MPPNHLILYRPLLLLPSVFPNNQAFGSIYLELSSGSLKDSTPSQIIR